MRGSNDIQAALLAVVKLEDFASTEHPLRPIHALANEALGRVDGLSNTIYVART